MSFSQAILSPAADVRPHVAKAPLTIRAFRLVNPKISVPSASGYWSGISSIPDVRLILSGVERSECANGVPAVL